MGLKIRLIIICLLIGSLIIPAHAQRKKGWSYTEPLYVEVRHSFSNITNSNLSFVADLLKFSNSFGKSLPYQKFGFGLSLAQMNIVVNSSDHEINARDMTLLPIYLHVIPWMKIKKYEFQPVEFSERVYNGTKYYYNPNKTGYDDVTSDAIIISLMATFWGMGDEIIEYDGTTRKFNRRYFNLSTEYNHNFRSLKKGGVGQISLSLVMNNYLGYENGKWVYLPSIGIKIPFCIFEITY